MKLEQDVAAHYTPGTLEQKIMGALREAGKNSEQLRTDDLALLDEFHVGGREATQALADFMDLRAGMRVLDVGCGIGGPARYFAERGCRVTGVDLSQEFIGVAESLTRKLRLERSATFRCASALELPFESGTFDRAYEIHVGMNIVDKERLFKEVRRVLKRDGRFAIFDIMRTGEGDLAFPVPWAPSEATSFVATPDEYRQGLQDAGFRISHERGRRQFSIDFMQSAMARTASEKPVLALHLIMGEQTGRMLQNVMAAIASGVLEPVEMVAIAE